MQGYVAFGKHGPLHECADGVLYYSSTRAGATVFHSRSAARAAVTRSRKKYGEKLGWDRDERIIRLVDREY